MTVSIAAIKGAVAQTWGVTVTGLISSRRSAEVAIPRFAAYRLCKTMTVHSLPTIGQHFGGRDHTTIVHGLRRAENLFLHDAGFAEKYKAAEAAAPNIFGNPDDADAMFWRCADAFTRMAKAHGYLVTMERR